MIQRKTRVSVSKIDFTPKKKIYFSTLKIVWLIVLCGFCVKTKAQQTPIDTSLHHSQNLIGEGKLLIHNILVYGNKKTKKYIILREMHLHKGDIIVTGNLNEELEKAREFIYNTTLFEKVTVLPHLLNDHELEIIITVKEKWYIYPIPSLELAARSFNEWIHSHHADLKRLSYGIRFSHVNFSGKRDVLSLNLVNGFKRNISVDYSLPYINAALTNGLKLGAGFSQTKEIAYAADDENKLQYYERGGYELNEWNVSAAYSLRKKLKKKQTFSAKFRHINIADSIISKYNPLFFNSPSSTQNFVDLEYQLDYDDIDNVLYPLRGNSFSLSIKKRGFGFTGGLNLFSVQPSFDQYFSLSKNWYSSIRFTGEIKLPFEQPYYNLKALGYGENYIRGLEYFVIDGVAFGLAKFDLKRKLIHFEIPTFFKSKLLDKIPFTLYAKTYADVGYVYSRFDSKLNNRFLYGVGFGIDIVTLYDFNVSVEYSFNQLGQKGLFLHQ